MHLKDHIFIQVGAVLVAKILKRLAICTLH